MGKANFSGDRAIVELVSALLDGSVLDVPTVEDLIGVKRNAARDKLAALKALKGIDRKLVGQRETLRYTRPDAKPVSGLDVGAACLVSSFGTALRETQFREPLKRIVRDLVSRTATYCGASNLDRKFWFVVRGGEKALPSAERELTEVIEALLGDLAIRFHYVHFDGKEETVEVQPLTLAVHEHQLYLITRNARNGEVYPYRFARMSRVQVRAGFTYPSTAEYDPAILFRSTFGIFVSSDDPVEKIHIRLTKRWRTYAQSHRWHESQTLRNRPDGSVDIILQVRVSHELKRWILWFGPDAEVIAPLTLRETIASELTAAAARYAQATSLPMMAKRTPRKARHGILPTSSAPARRRSR